MTTWNEDEAIRASTPMPQKLGGSAKLETNPMRHDEGVAWSGLLSRPVRFFARQFLLSLLEHYLAGSIARGCLSRWMQRLEKCDECGGFRRTQVFSISRHVAASLNYLPDELVVREPHSDGVQGGASVPTAPSKGMAVATLFDLKNERALPLERSRVKDHSLRHWITAPGVHVRTPRRELSHACKCSQRDGDQQHSQNRNRSPTPALFSFTGEKWKKQQTEDHHDGTNQHCRSFERRRQQRKYGIEPQEKEIRPRHSLDNRRIRFACRTKWAEVEGASGDCQEHEPREEHI